MAKNRLKTSLLIFFAIAAVVVTIDILLIRYKPGRSAAKPAVSMISVNGVNYQSTGALPPSDTNGFKAIDEMIALSDKGKITTSKFRITPRGGSNFLIEILPPYDTNKTLFLNWLKTNGYSHINPDQLNYSNVAK